MPVSKHRKKPLNRAQCRRRSGIDPLAYANALAGVVALKEDQQRDLALHFWGALNRITQGGATEEHASMLALSLNVAMLLAEGGAGAEHLEAIKTAQADMVRAIERYGAHGRYGFSGDEIKRVREALKIHEGQLEVVPRSAVKKTLEELHRRYSGGHVMGVT
jgi:hypothetical protein